MKNVCVALMITFILAACTTGYAVPDKAAAIRIAKADYFEKTGEEMDKDHPLEVFSRGELWLVTVRLPLNTFGGGPAIEINKKTGEIVRRYRTQ